MINEIRQIRSINLQFRCHCGRCPFVCLRFSHTHKHTHTRAQPEQLKCRKKRLHIKSEFSRAAEFESKMSGSNHMGTFELRRRASPNEEKNFKALPLDDLGMRKSGSLSHSIDMVTCSLELQSNQADLSTFLPQAFDFILENVMNE